MTPPFPSFLKTTRLTAAFSLVEMLVAVTVVAVLASLLTTATQGVLKSSAETKAVASLKAVVQANALYAGDNNGQIVTIRWDTDPLSNPWVSGSFWGRLQPYLFPEITTTNQNAIAAEINPKLNRLFGTKLFGDSKMTTLKGTPFDGPRIYADKSGLRIPFGINKYLYEFTNATNDGWVKQQTLHNLPSTIYLTYGRALFDEEDAKTYEPMPKNGSVGTNNIFYLPSERTIAGFLDGRVEYLAPPIAEKMVKIDGSGQ